MTLNLIHRVLGRITAVAMVFSIDPVSVIFVGRSLTNTDGQELMFFFVVLCDQARIQPRVTGFPLTPLTRNLPNLLLARKEKKNNQETSVRGGVSVWIRRVLLLFVKKTQIRAATCECTLLALTPPFLHVHCGGRFN